MQVTSFWYKSACVSAVSGSGPSLHRELRAKPGRSRVTILLRVASHSAEMLSAHSAEPAPMPCISTSGAARGSASGPEKTRVQMRQGELFTSPRLT